MDAGERIDCDVLVVGSGAGGLSAALTAALAGLKTLVVEKDDCYGGISAWSGGWLWIPGNPIAVRDGVQDSVEAARSYLRTRLGDQYDEALVEAYLESGPEMVATFMRDTAVVFEGAGYIFPDYHPETEGSAHGSGVSRSIRAVPIDGRQLRPETARRLRPPLPQMTLFGMMLASLVEARHFVNVTRSWASARYVARKTRRYLVDRIVHGRDMSLVNGSALIARLAKSLDEAGGTIRVCTPATGLIVEAGAVVGAIVRVGGAEARVRAARGVVLACGGFSHDADRQRRFYTHVAAGGVHLPVAPDSNTGDGLTLGEQAGGYIVEGRPWNCLFMPTSRLPDRQGSAALVPHIWDRSKPGFIAVTPAGERFVDESASYMNFGQAMVRASSGGADVRAFLVCDDRAMRRYGLGAVRPGLPMRSHLRSGYLKRAGSVADLARQLGIPAARLVETVDRYNLGAERGEDPQFGKGRSPFSRFQGDPDQSPNPNVAPLARAPYYAVEIFCGDFGTFTGLRTNADAQVLRRDGSAVPGLYAAGNDMATMMGSHSVGGGITLGPAMVFGYRAARHLSALRPAVRDQ